MDPSQLVALVTGGGSGIGLACVARLLERGIRVYTTGRSPERWAQAVADTPRVGAAHFRQVDMRDFRALRALVAEVARDAGALDILINNAGIMNVGPTHSLGDEAVAEELEVLLHGPITLTQAVIGQMLARRRGGHIINISSTAASIPSPRMSVYGAAKAGLLHFTRSIAAEYGSSNIRANAICPGGVDTNLTSKSMLAQIARATPLGRLARPDEIAALVLYLLGPDATYVTGGAFTIDGGVSLGPVTKPGAFAAAEELSTASGRPPVAVPRTAPTPAPTPAASSAAPATAPAAKPASATESSLLPRVARVMERAFAYPADAITPETTPEVVEKWSSLGHMNLILLLEEEFGVRLDVDDAMEMVSVAEIVRILAGKLEARR